MSSDASDDAWRFGHHQADGADWTQGMRAIFEYRDLGHAGHHDEDATL